MCMRTMLTQYVGSQQENHMMGAVKNDLNLLFIMQI